MSYTVFFSWQSDSPKESNKDFILEALQAASSELPQGSVIRAIPRVDEGMDGVAGTPEVASVMFQKIRDSAILVADMTLTGEALRADGRKQKTPNSNVSLELGYAAGVLGWERVICVMNEHFAKRSALPFDVRNRRFPINYDLSPSAAEPKRQEVKANLAETLAFALKTIDNNEFQRAITTAHALDRKSLSVLHFYRNQQSFCEPDRADDAGVSFDFNFVIPRLLDLKIVLTHFNGETGQYSYHWTYLGRKILKRLTGNEPPFDPSQAPPHL